MISAISHSQPFIPEGAVTFAANVAGGLAATAAVSAFVTAAPASLLIAGCIGGVVAEDLARAAFAKNISHSATAKLIQSLKNSNTESAGHAARELLVPLGIAVGATILLSAIAMPVIGAVVGEAGVAAAVAKPVLWIVDDEELIRFGLNDAFERAFAARGVAVEIVEFESAVQAEAALQKGAANLVGIFSDNTMPGKKGADFLVGVIEDHPSLPVCLHTTDPLHFLVERSRDFATKINDVTVFHVQKQARTEAATDLALKPFIDAVVSKISK